MRALINAIASDLQAKGWVNGNPATRGGTCLGVSAAGCALVAKTAYWEIEQLLLTAAHIQTGRRWRNIPAYNDHPGRTFAEVLGVLEIARDLSEAPPMGSEASSLETA